jgi:hypothetical protein
MRANSADTIRNLVTAIPEQRLRALVAEVAISALRCLMTGAPELATTTPPASTDKMRRHWSQPRRAAHNAKRREKRQLAKAAAHVRQPAPDSAGKSMRILLRHRSLSTANGASDRAIDLARPIDHDGVVP